MLQQQEFIEIRVMSRPGIGKSGLVSSIANVLQRNYRLPVTYGNEITQTMCGAIDGFDREEMMSLLPSRIAGVRISSVNVYDKIHKYSPKEEVPAEKLLEVAEQQVEFLRRSLKKITLGLGKTANSMATEANLALKHSLGRDYADYMQKPVYKEPTPEEIEAMRFIAPALFTPYEHLMEAAKALDEKGLPQNADGLRSLARDFFRDTARPGKDPLWHAPGMGEVHSHDHRYMIDCQRETEGDDADQDYVADEDLARKVAAALNAAGIK
jgi:hypothetical protein